ncbi:hypothetical protein AFE_0136 [Acidithiobacillus ferrooxidans ATCC 23270]|uniref:Uncharacterized protein n=1 Tax=Acidithiobacillus ferrooxidans (strain ATCC 23270 / DSM 14882 / CIP 104768 / NCIMB 8455) TaxID=243159 RepID=B7J3N3_ACIF2|nr:hypothetical protein AFE_0136 [Acidithiobacillus ferrooxidans ATCC 23270]
MTLSFYKYSHRSPSANGVPRVEIPIIPKSLCITQCSWETAT